MLLSRWRETERYSEQETRREYTCARMIGNERENESEREQMCVRVRESVARGREKQGRNCTKKDCQKDEQRMLILNESQSVREILQSGSMSQGE